jgi:hypothetical protein
MAPALLAGFILLATIAIVSTIRDRIRRRTLESRLTLGWGHIRPASDLADERVREAWSYSIAINGPLADDLDERSWDDLHMDRVFATLDRSASLIGRQVFYSSLHRAPPSRSASLVENLAAHFASCPKARLNAQVTLSYLGDRAGYLFWKLTSDSTFPIRWWYHTFPLLGIAMVAALIAMFLYPPFVLAVVGLAMLNMYVHSSVAWQLQGLVGSFRQIAPLLRTARRLGKQGSIDHETSTAGIRGDLHALRPLGRLARHLSPDPQIAGDLAASLFEYLNMLFLLDANALMRARNAISRHGGALARVAEWVGHVDLALVVASLRAETRSWVIPEGADDTSATVIDGIWHPLLTEPVANDVILRGGRGVVVTGANMSGKSTYLRAVGISLVLARSINTVPASRYHGRRMNVKTLIGRSDDLTHGRSYYLVEVQRVVEMLRYAAESRSTFFIFDELFRGTNTVERISAGEAVLTELLTGPDAARTHSAIVATHDGELVPLQEPLYEPRHFRERLSDSGVVFDYEIHAGQSRTRTALALLEAAGAPPRVLEMARARAAAMDAESAGAI